MTKKTGLSKHKRETSKLKPFVVTGRDQDILQALGEYRYLRVDQVKRLFFRENKDLQSPNRRLKYLYHGKYINKVSTYGRRHDVSPQWVYFLDKKGMTHLHDRGISARIWPKTKQVKFNTLQHALDLSDFRINLELGLESSDVVSLKTFIPDFQMTKVSALQSSRNKRIAYTTIVSPVNKQSYIIYPDALIVLQALVEDVAHEKLYFLEIDRGTHGLQVVCDKVHGYYLYHQKKFHASFGDFTDFKVLIQTSGEKRADNLRKMLADRFGSERVWVTDYEKVNEQSLLYDPIWKGVDGKARSILLNSHA